MHWLVENCSFLGIDECNHGRDPEIVVGAYSNNPVSLRALELRKDRDDRRTIESILKNEYKFRYIMFTSEFRNSFDDELMKLIALVELVRAAKCVQKVLVDGRIDRKVLPLFDKCLNYENVPKLRIAPRADQTYPIVNTADSLANVMYRMHGRKDTALQESLRHRLYPSIEYYRQIL